MMNIKKISIIGLGLIGGSLAKAIKKYMPETIIYGHDINDAYLETALSANAIDKAFSAIDHEFCDVDIIFICVPIEFTNEIIDQVNLYAQKNTIVTDVCSTKTEIINYVNSIEHKFIFIPAHPMTGSEKFGFNVADETIYENAYYIICMDVEDNNYNKLKYIIEKIKSIPIKISPEKHDYYLAFISHFPHIVAAGLVNLAKDSSNSEILKVLAAGGFKDITRIASSNPKLWSGITLSNKENLSDLIDTFIEILTDYKNDLANANTNNLIVFFEKAGNYRNSFIDSDKGIFALPYEISLDVEDKPGVIADISKYLMNNNINVKNIYISSSREFESGALRILLENKTLAQKAYNILKSAGYKVLM